MFWLFLGLAVAAVWMIASGSRTRKQRLVQSAWRNAFPTFALLEVDGVAPNLAERWGIPDYSRQFDLVFAELLRRFEARDFAELMRRFVELGPEQGEAMTEDIFNATVDELPGESLEYGERVLVAAALRRALERAGAAAQSAGERSGEV